MADLLSRHSAQLLLEWLNGRLDRSFAFSGEGTAEAEAGVDVLTAVDGEYRLALAVAPLYEEGPPEWREGLETLEGRLSGSLPGAHVLWVPPRAAPPFEEPQALEFTRRVRLAAAPLVPGGRAEVQLPVRLGLGKVQEEGSLVSVDGGLARWWAEISEGVTGSYRLDSMALHRAPAEERVRQTIFRRIAEAAAGLEVGEVVTFDATDAWTVQRLRDGEGMVIVASPPEVDPTEAAGVRRLLRRGLAAANTALEAEDADLKGVAAVGIYEYAEQEGVRAALRAFDPSLYMGLDLICVLVDGEVRPAVLPRSLPWAGGSRS
jgi:hypothetical protein